MADFELTKAAADDLAEIYLYTYAKYGEAQAERYVSQINDRLPVLADSPMLGHTIDDLPRYRRFNVGRHAVIYRPGGPGIVVVRVIHDARNIDRRVSEAE